MMMKPEHWISIYAAVVATTAFFLNFRTWFESGVRLHLRAMSDAIMIGNGRDDDEKDLMVLTVTNRGKTSTTITHMVIFEMTSLWQRIRQRPKTSLLVPNPQPSGHPTILPS